MRRVTVTKVKKKSPRKVRKKRERKVLRKKKAKKRKPRNGSAVLPSATRPVSIVPSDDISAIKLVGLGSHSAFSLLDKPRFLTGRQSTSTDLRTQRTMRARPARRHLEMRSMEAFVVAAKSRRMGKSARPGMFARSLVFRGHRRRLGATALERRT